MDIMYDGLVTLALFIALTAPFYFFIFRGRRRGFEALTCRTAQLQQYDTGNVYYLCSNSFVGDNAMPIGLGGGMSALLNTGYIAYEQDGALMIEAPWWNTMHLFRNLRPGTLDLQLQNEYRASRPKPGVYIGDRTFVVAGLNVVNPKQAGILWRLKDMTQLEANREVMVDHLMRMGFQFSNS